MKRVQLIFDPDTVAVYKDVIKDIDVIRDKIKDNDASEEDSEVIIPMLKKFLKLCCVNEGNEGARERTKTHTPTY
jgi:hypothetical protein